MHGGHFIEEDLGAFDAPFFSISPAEAMGMDPQQQMMLEITYRALENGNSNLVNAVWRHADSEIAGIPIEEAQGSLTSVHVGCFTDDYSHVAFKDVDQISKYSATGTSATMLSNRISWFFDLKGMAVTVDSACSSSMVALDLACQGLWSHAASMVCHF
jgi:acyl transferase domain-containing protein